MVDVGVIYRKLCQDSSAHLLCASAPRLLTAVDSLVPLSDMRRLLAYFQDVKQIRKKIVMTFY